MAKKKQTEIVEVVAKCDKPAAVSEIENMIFSLRGTQVMLDSDLAMLYGIETRVLNQAVKRNLDRFPDDFMFRLTTNEYKNLKSQIVTSSSQLLKSQIVTSNEINEVGNSDSGWGGTRKLPYAFTENGIAMLSSVLRSPVAIEVNIRIMRAFTAMRHFMASNVMVFQRLEVIEHHQLELSARQTDTEQKIEEVFKRLDNGKVQPSQGIFFDGQIFDAYTFVSDLIRSAKKRIILFDNYVDDSVLAMLDKRADGVSAQIYTRTLTPQLTLDLQRHNAQYSPIAINEFQNAHDRFLCIDDTVYHIGASLKDLGKKWFAFGRMEVDTDMLLQKM